MENKIKTIINEIELYDDPTLYETEDPYEEGFTDADAYDPTTEDPHWFDDEDEEEKENSHE